MKSTCWLICLMMGFNSVAFAQVGPSGPPGFPNPPTVPPITAPNCPVSLMGIVDGVYYWVTASCPISSSNPMGYGQSMGPLQTGCNGSTCYSPVVLIFQQQETIESGQVELKAKALPAGTQEQRKTKLDEIIKESEKLQQYLERLAKSPDIDLDHKNRLNAWINYLPKLITYLKDTSPSPPADSVEKKIANYTDKVVVEFEKDKAEWRRPKLKLAKGTARHRDEQQTNAPVGADNVTIEPKPGFEIMPQRDASGKEICYEVDVKDLASGATKTVYFKPYTIRSKTDQFVYTQVGVQVLDAGNQKVKKAKFADRNSFAHRLDDGGTPFLVQSYDDLSIE